MTEYNIIPEREVPIKCPNCGSTVFRLSRIDNDSMLGIKCDKCENGQMLGRGLSVGDVLQYIIENTK